jgi:hypothetical protein
MKTKIILVLIAIISAVSTNAQTTELSSSPVGKLLFVVDAQKTTIVKSNDEANKAMNSGVEDILLIEDGITIRFLVLSDGRLIRLESQGSVRFYFVSQYYNEDKIDQEKLVECYIDQNGKVSEIKTKYHVDPNGKNGFVVANETVASMKSSGAVFEYNGAPPISKKDPLVIRYQKEIDTLLKLF